MKGKDYVTMPFFNLQSNRKILNSLAEIKDNINKHIKVEKNVLI